MKMRSYAAESGFLGSVRRWVMLIQERGWTDCMSLECKSSPGFVQLYVNRMQ